MLETNMLDKLFLKIASLKTSYSKNSVKDEAVVRRLTDVLQNNCY